MHMNQRENFVRIAMARLRKLYPYTRQRLAVAGKMYSRWLDKNNSYILDVNSCQITFWTTPYQEKDVTDDYHYHYLYTLINEELPKIPFAGN